MLLLLAAAFSDPQCAISLNLNRSVRSLTQRLSSGQCLALDADGHNSRFSYWAVSSPNSIRIENYLCKWVGPGCTLSWSGDTPDVNSFSRVRHAPLKYYFTALSDTSVTLTYADLLDFRCDRVLLSTGNSWHFSAAEPIQNRTCLLSGFPNSKSVDVTSSDCPDGPCGGVELYGSGPRNDGFIENITKTGSRTDLQSPLLIVVGPSTSGISIQLNSQGEPFPSSAIVDWPSEGVLDRKSVV
jgi:hypothetical protein